MPEFFEEVGTVGQIAPKFWPALSLLQEGNNYSQQTTGNLWEFAVEIAELRQYGLSDNDLRFLVQAKLVTHAVEIEHGCTTGRRFKPGCHLHFSDQTCFILTPTGIALVTELFRSSAGRHELTPAALRLVEESDGINSYDSPAWDSQRLVLSFGGQNIKQYRWRASNQELVLSAFQEEGWPFRIDDPLPPMPEQASKRRLSDTIKYLNRHHSVRLIRFRGDGSGQGIVWELVSGPAFGTAGQAAAIS